MAGCSADRPSRSSGIPRVTTSAESSEDVDGSSDVPQEGELASASDSDVEKSGSDEESKPVESLDTKDKTASTDCSENGQGDVLGEKRASAQSEKEMSPNESTSRTPNQTKNPVSPDTPTATQPVSKPSMDPSATKEEEVVLYAQAYLDSYPYSRSKLIEILQDLGYSKTDATYGVDHCGANWNDLASQMAKKLLDFGKYGFAKCDLVKQVEEWGFTHEQAVYGVDHCGANWNEQALTAAEYIMKNDGYTPDLLSELLETKGFEKEQISYAIDHADWEQEAYEYAKKILQSGGYSRAYMINLLKKNYESHVQAEACIDKCGMDWNQQAVIMANYISSQDSFSPAEMKACLQEDHLFTSEQAEYGMSHCSADWNACAVIYAQSYLEQVPTLTGTELKATLQSKGQFSESQAQYAIDTLGIAG